MRISGTTRELIILEMPEDEKDLALSADHRMAGTTRKWQRLCQNIAGKKNPCWSLKMELFMNKILTIVKRSTRTCSFVHTFFFVIFHYLEILFFVIGTDIYESIALE